MADSVPTAAVGYILTKHYDVFDQCTGFCYAKNLNYHSNYIVCEYKNSFTDRILHFVYLFSREDAIKVVNFMDKLGLKYLYVNIVI